MKLAELTWPEVEAIDRGATLVIAPYGACEQHSHHLPFFTDSLLVTAVAEGMEQQLGKRALLLPTQWLGASAHHLPMVGTLTAGLETHVRLITEPLTPLLQRGFRHLLIVNGHGGNIDTYHLALRHLQPQFPEAVLAGASYWEAAEKVIEERLRAPLKRVGHACELETALMLAVRPDLVRRDQVRDDYKTLAPALAGVTVISDFKRMTHHGGQGFPTHATPAAGADLLQAIVARMVEVAETLMKDAGYRAR
jgi:creatinine amidohydrolase